MKHPQQACIVWTKQAESKQHAAWKCIHSPKESTHECIEGGRDPKGKSKVLITALSSVLIPRGHSLKLTECSVKLTKCFLEWSTVLITALGSCRLNDPWMWTRCSLNVHRMFPECAPNVPWNRSPAASTNKCASQSNKTTSKCTSQNDEIRTPPTNVFNETSETRGAPVGTSKKERPTRLDHLDMGCGLWGLGLKSLQGYNPETLN
jgi:hypothetical protein